MGKLRPLETDVIKLLTSPVTKGAPRNHHYHKIKTRIQNLVLQILLFEIQLI